MGQHIASTMAQIVCEELGAKWSDMRVNARLQRSEVQRPRAGCADHRRQLVDHDELRRDEPGRRRRTDGIDGRRGRRDGRAGVELVVRDSVIVASEVEEADVVRRCREERQGDQDLHAGRAEGDQAEDAGSVHHDRRVGAAARHPLQDQRHGQVRHRRDAAGHGLWRGGDAAGALRRHGEVGRRQRLRRRCRASSRPSPSTTRPARQPAGSSRSPTPTPTPRRRPRR